MKIITRAEFQMTENIGEYVPLSEKSYEYVGPVAKAGGDGKDGPDTGDLEEMMRFSMENAQLMKSLGMDQLNWAKEQWPSQQALMNSILETQHQLGQDVTGQAEQWMQRYEEKFVPLADQLVRDAEQFNSEWRREQEAGAAGADVAQAASDGPAGRHRGGRHNWIGEPVSPRRLGREGDERGDVPGPGVGRRCLLYTSDAADDRT